MFTHSVDLKHNDAFLSLPNDFFAIINTHPRDVDTTREVFSILADFLSVRSETISQLANVTHPLSAYCISTLQDDECSIDVQFNVCQYYSVLIPSFVTVEEKTLVARLILKCINRAKDEKRDLLASVFSAASSIILCYSVHSLSKDPTHNTTPLSLTYSEFQKLLGITLSHTDNLGVLLQSVSVLHNLMELTSSMRYSTELLTGLRYALVYLHKAGEIMAVRIILSLIYGIAKRDREQARALVDSEIARCLTEVRKLYSNCSSR